MVEFWPLIVCFSDASPLSRLTTSTLAATLTFTAEIQSETFDVFQITKRSFAALTVSRRR